MNGRVNNDPPFTVVYNSIFGVDNIAQNTNVGFNAENISSVTILVHFPGKNKNRGYSNYNLSYPRLLEPEVGINKNTGFAFSLFSEGSTILSVGMVGNNINSALDPALNLGEKVLLSVSNTAENFNRSSRTITITENLVSQIAYNDSIYLLISDNKGNTKVYRGIVKEKNPQGRRLTITANLGDGILAERIIKENYPKQDIGATVTEIIEEYCNPLTANNVQEIGIEAPVQAKNKKPITVLENLRQEYNLYYFVSWKWDLNFYKKNYIEDEPKHKVRVGD